MLAGDFPLGLERFVAGQVFGLQYGEHITDFDVRPGDGRQDPGQIGLAHDVERLADRVFVAEIAVDRPFRQDDVRRRRQRRGRVAAGEAQTTSEEARAATEAAGGSASPGMA